MMTLVDITLRPDGTVEVAVEPDGTTEVAISSRSSSLTLLLTPDQAKALRDQLDALTHLREDVHGR
jgi:hypothetical protein